MGDESGKISWMPKVARMAVEDPGMVEVDVDDISLSKLRHAATSSGDTKPSAAATSTKQLSKPPLSPPRPVLSLSPKSKASPASGAAAASQAPAPAPAPAPASLEVDHVFLPVLNDSGQGGGADGSDLEQHHETPKAANHRRYACLSLISLGTGT
jgi:hypothetical protein